MFRAGLALAAAGLVWTAWPAPGGRAYPFSSRGGHAMYHHGPRVMVDLGHWNSAPADPRFVGLSDLLTWDGYQVSRARQHLVPELIEDAQVLIIAGALPYPAGWRSVAEALGWTRKAAFAPEEITAVRDWVAGGGGLFLAANVAGSARGSEGLAAAFGVAFHECAAEAFLGGEAAVLARGWVDGPPGAAALLTAPADSGFCGNGKALVEAVEFGRGRVAAVAARFERDEDRMRGAANRQFVLDVMHWLSRAGN